MTSLTPDPPPFDIEEMLVSVLLTHEKFPAGTLQIVNLFDGDRPFSLMSPVALRMAAERPSIVASLVHLQVPFAAARVFVTFDEDIDRGRVATSSVRSVLDDPDTFAFHVSLTEWVSLDDGSTGSYEDLKSHPSTLAALFDTGKTLP